MALSNVPLTPRVSLMLSQSLPTANGIQRLSSFVTSCLRFSLLLVLLWPSGAWAQDKFKKLEAGEQVEVNYLGDWCPGVVQAVDKDDNARVEFNFLGKTGTVDNFYREAIRRPYEEGALLPSRTYTDKSGQFKTVAALMAITDTEVRLRKPDGTDKDVPLESLSEADQRYLAGLIKKGLQKSDEMPPTYVKGQRTWTLKSGETVVGVFVEYANPNVVIRLADQTTREIHSDELAKEDFLVAMQSESVAAMRRDRTKAPEYAESTEKAEAEERERKAEKGPSVERLVKPLPTDRWGFSPDAVTPLSHASKVEIPVERGVDLVMPNRTGSHVLVLGGLLETGFLVDALGGKIAKAAKLPVDGMFAISPSGKLAVHELWSSIAISETVSGTLVWENWYPYGKFGEVFHVDFVDEEHVLTVSSAGDLGVWNLQSKEVVWWTKSRPKCRPAISAGNKLMFVQTMTHLLVLESLTGKVVSQTPSSPTTIELLAVDHACERLAGIGVGQVRVWDLQTGQMLQQFAVSPSVIRPRSAAWLSPTLLATGSEIVTYFDLIDLRLQGTVCCLNSNMIRSLASNSELYLKPMSGPPNIFTPKIPFPEMTKAAQAFESSLLCDLKPGSRVMLRVNAAPSYNKAAETEQLTKLLTDSGLTVVAEGGEATFVANLREAYKGPDKPLDELSSEAFESPRSLLLMSGDRGVWRAYRDSFVENPKGFAGYIIPPMIRFQSSPTPAYCLGENGEWILGTTNEDHSNRTSRDLRFRSGAHPAGAFGPGGPPGGGFGPGGPPPRRGLGPGGR